MIVLVGFIATVGTVGAGRVATQSLHDSIDRALSAAAEAHEQTRTIAGPRTAGQVARPNPGSISLGVLAFEVSDHNGTVVERTGQFGSPTLSELKNRTGYMDVDNWRVLVWTRNDGGRLLVATQRDYVDSVNRSVWASLGAMLVVVLLSLVLAMMWLLRSVVRPLNILAATAEQVTDGNTDVRVMDEALLPEAAVVGAAMNRMLDAQQASFETERAAGERIRDFVADASHELRTPLTAISGWASLLADERTSDTRRAQGVARIRSEAARMTRLVEDLLVLARADQQHDLGVQGGCDAGEVLAETVADHQMLDSTRPVELDLDEPAVVSMNKDAFSQVAGNLLANLRAHTPEGTTATISVRVHEQAVQIDYRDNGPGVQDPKSVFNRFWQADPSRVGSGTGLGLAVVHALVDAVGGVSMAKNGVGGGFHVRLGLPRGDLEVSGNPRFGSKVRWKAHKKRP
jgi:two-component system OmpR family sensor kinase